MVVHRHLQSFANRIEQICSTVIQIWDLLQNLTKASHDDQRAKSCNCCGQIFARERLDIQTLMQVDLGRTWCACSLALLLFKQGLVWSALQGSLLKASPSLLRLGRKAWSYGLSVCRDCAPSEHLASSFGSLRLWLSSLQNTNLWIFTLEKNPCEGTQKVYLSTEVLSIHCSNLRRCCVERRWMASLRPMGLNRRSNVSNSAHCAPWVPLGVLSVLKNMLYIPSTYYTSCNSCNSNKWVFHSASLGRSSSLLKFSWCLCSFDVETC